MDSANMPIWDARWLGRMEYAEAWQLQDRFAAEIAEGKRPPTVLLLEHPHVYTLGRRGHAENVLWNETERSQNGVSLINIDRGGDVTYHGPGQLVGYPLLPLAPAGWFNAQAEATHLPQADYVGYLRNLEKTLVFALAQLGVVAGQRPGLTGVWVAADVWARCPRCDPKLKPEPAKIASIGVKVDVHGISRHGFALNIATDPFYWGGIVPCGLEHVQMANLADFINPPPTMEAIREAVLNAFEEVFHCQLRRLEGL